MDFWDVTDLRGDKQAKKTNHTMAELAMQMEIISRARSVSSDCKDTLAFSHL
jgi:hypothetical protein